MISCNGWPDSYQQQNALKPHCMNTITYWDAWHLITGRMLSCMMRRRKRYHELSSHRVKVGVYKPSKMTIKRWHCSGNEKNKLEQQSTVNIQNTEEDLKILLRILSIKTLSNLLLLSTYVISHNILGHRLTQSQYAHQKNIEHF